MTVRSTTTLASVTVLMAGVFWGLYWIPVRGLDDLGLPGAWGTVAITVAACLILAPFAWRHAAAIRAAGPLVLASAALGGAAFSLYSMALVNGRVAIVTLLFYLTPVWSTLIGWVVMRWPVSTLRILAIGVGIVGLLVMLGAHGGVPIPREAGEWMSLMAGVFWAFSTTGLRVKSELRPVPTAFVFAAGALVAAFGVVVVTEPWPAGPALPTGSVIGLALLAGGVWWVLSNLALMWATVRLEPARVGILLMSEVLAGAVTAAAFAGEMLSPMEIAGGALVLVAGVLEVWPTKPGAQA